MRVLLAYILVHCVVVVIDVIDIYVPAVQSTE